jgi:hypothetical protein
MDTSTAELGTDGEMPHEGATHNPPVEEKLREKLVEIDFRDIQDSNEEVKDEFKQLDPKTLKLLWHYRLGHLPFSTINRVTKRGELPKRLARCPDLMCTSCIYGHMTKKPWRTRAEPITIARQRSITQPGDCVSIDQMESPVPGFVAHIKGTPTKERYNSATVLTDYFSDMTYVHLQKSTNAK